MKINIYFSNSNERVKESTYWLKCLFIIEILSLPYWYSSLFKQRINLSVKNISNSSDAIWNYKQNVSRTISWNRRGDKKGKIQIDKWPKTPKTLCKEDINVFCSINDRLADKMSQIQDSIRW